MHSHFENFRDYLPHNFVLLCLPNSRVKYPWYVGGTKDQDAVIISAHPLHLDEELGLDSSGRLGLVVGTGPAQGINFV